MVEQVKINYFLLPFSYLYGLGVAIRNLLFDWGWLTIEEFDVPIFCVGNITVGGTGKTPHVEYLTRLLSKNYRVAVLSRGYKRSTNGFVLLSSEHTAQQVGDEPCQIKQKFPHIPVAVDKNRRRGVRKLMQADPSLDVILLDDGFQHRYIRPQLNVVLVDYHRLPFYDRLLPAGRLREPLSACKERINIYVVTKTPNDLKPIDYLLISKSMNPYPFQSVFYSGFEYSDLQPLFPDLLPARPLGDLANIGAVLLLTGIANPHVLINDLSVYPCRLTPLSFSDHHNFSKNDMKRILNTFNGMPEENKIILTTEKDGVRLKSSPFLSDDLKAKIYMLPICVKVNNGDEFDKIFIDYVRKNKSNRSVLARQSRQNS